MTDRTELPDLPTDADGNNLGWHALNYRTAHTVHAQALFVELERYVRAYGLQCAMAERERCAKLCEDHIVTDHHTEGVVLKESRGPFIHDGQRYAAAIRKGT